MPLTTARRDSTSSVRPPRLLAGHYPVAQRADRGLDVVAFEREPLRTFARAVAVAGRYGVPSASNPQDRVRFGEHTAIVEADRRHRAGRIDREIVGPLAFAFEDADDFGAIRLLQVIEQQADFQAFCEGR